MAGSNEAGSNGPGSNGPGEREQLLRELRTALAWARFGGAETVERAQPAATAPTSSTAPGPRPQASTPKPQASTPKPQASTPKPQASSPTILAHPIGPADATLAIICTGKWGDGPGACWQGPAGELLARMIGAMKLDPEQVYAVTLVEVPEGEEVPPDERPPALSQQLKSTSYKALMIFGEQTAHWILRNDLPIDSMRGSWRQLAGRPTMITYGPQLLLSMPMFKAITWKDMQEVMTRLGS